MSKFTLSTKARLYVSPDGFKTMYEIADLATMAPKSELEMQDVTVLQDDGNKVEQPTQETSTLEIEVRGRVGLDNTGLELIKARAKSKNKLGFQFYENKTDQPLRFSRYEAYVSSVESEHNTTDVLLTKISLSILGSTVVTQG